MSVVFKIHLLWVGGAKVKGGKSCCNGKIA